MADYHQANDEANKTIIQELAERSGDTEVSAIISCYNIGATGTDIRKEMNKHKVAPLKKCATYLRIPTDADNPKKKPQIITDIMTKINCLLMDLCGVCGDYFNIDLNDQPLFTCIICQQGCHRKCFEPVSTLFRQLDANHLKAIQFVCSSCYSDHSPDRDTEVVVNAKKSPIKAKPQSPDELEEEADEEPPVNSNNPLIHKDNHHEHSHDPEKTTSDTDSGQPIKKPICPQYKYGRCMNYDTCKDQYDHPRRCRNWMMFGKCRFSTSCKYHHPKLCFSSLAERKCTNLECKYFHLRYTQRYEQLSEEAVGEYQQMQPPPRQSANFPPLPPPVSQHPQQAAQNRQNPPIRQRQQPPTSHENNFLYQYIQENNATMKNLQNLISSLLSTQNVGSVQVQAPAPIQNQYPAGSQNNPQIGLLVPAIPQNHPMQQTMQPQAPQIVHSG